MKAPENTLPDGDLRFLRDLVYRSTGVVIDESKGYLVVTRLNGLLQDEGFGSVDELVGSLRRSPTGRLRERFIESMVTTETSFFRDPRTFEVLADEVLPDLISRRHGQRSLNIWSAACAAGQEVFSLAIMLREQVKLPPEWTVSLAASDFSARMVERARSGLYTHFEVNRGLPTPYLIRHFDEAGLKYRVKEPLRSSIQFFRLNLTEAWPEVPKQDLILLRNVLIYFDLETRRRILGKIRRLLRPDGYLLLGSAETTVGIDPGFEPFFRAGTVFFRPRTEGGS
jgi:chemotaxis protein methyltransferase CheR